VTTDRGTWNPLTPHPVRVKLAVLAALESAAQAASGHSSAELDADPTWPEPSAVARTRLRRDRVECWYENPATAGTSTRFCWPTSPAADRRPWCDSCPNSVATAIFPRLGVAALEHDRPRSYVPATALAVLGVAAIALEVLPVAGHGQHLGSAQSGLRWPDWRSSPRFGIALEVSSGP